MHLSAGTRLGPYEILAPIKVGGMGEVWKARDSRLNRFVAIKISHATFNERFKKEALAIAALNHPSIATLYDIGDDYIVMEFIEGEPIRQPDGTRALLDIAVQIADGLAHAHVTGFVHRDLKPDNILLTKEGRVKILDFGLAKHSNPDETENQVTETISETEPGTAVGTVPYMSPEQARGQKVDAKSDQFSFGSILYELVTGKRAFQRETTEETIAAIIREPAESLPTSIPPPLRWIIQRCLSKAPDNRYDTTRGLYLELCTLRDHLAEVTGLPLQVEEARPLSKRDLEHLFIHFAQTWAGERNLWLLQKPPSVPGEQAKGVQSFLQNLGILPHSDSQPDNELRYAFLTSLLAHFRDGNPTYFGHWELGQGEERLKEMLSRWERHRVSSLPRASPARKIRVAVALARCIVDGVDCVLMIRSRATNKRPQGYWKFPGGSEKLSDEGNLKEAVTREMAEEVSITRPCLEVALEDPVLQKTWTKDSDRLGIRTQYDFNGFAVVIRKPDLTPLLKRGEIVIHTRRRDEVVTWMPWTEIVQNEYFANEAKELLEELGKLRFRDLPPSSTIGRTKDKVSR